MAFPAARRGGEIVFPPKLQHAIVIALEYRVALLGGELKSLEIGCFVRLEGLAVFFLHQRHAEHVDAVSLPRSLGIEHERAGNVVVLLRRACHLTVSSTIASGSRGCGILTVH